MGHLIQRCRNGHLLHLPTTRHKDESTACCETGVFAAGFEKLYRESLTCVCGCNGKVLGTREGRSSVAGVRSSAARVRVIFHAVCCSVV